MPSELHRICIPSQSLAVLTRMGTPLLVKILFDLWSALFWSFPSNQTSFTFLSLPSCAHFASCFWVGLACRLDFIVTCFPPHSCSGPWPSSSELSMSIYMEKLSPMTHGATFHLFPYSSLKCDSRVALSFQGAYLWPGVCCSPTRGKYGRDSLWPIMFSPTSWEWSPASLGWIPSSVATQGTSNPC